jgi:hypothetical protein
MYKNIIFVIFTEYTKYSNKELPTNTTSADTIEVKHWKKMNNIECT